MKKVSILKFCIALQLYLTAYDAYIAAIRSTDADEEDLLLSNRDEDSTPSASKRPSSVPPTTSMNSFANDQFEQFWATVHGSDSDSDLDLEDQQREFHQMMTRLTNYRKNKETAGINYFLLFY